MEKPDLGLVDGVVSETILAAFREASAVLAAAGIPHLVIGGLAVGAWGHPRATKDVDFLVRESDAFDVHGLILTFKAGLPVSVRRVVIDYLMAEDYRLERRPELGVVRECTVAPIEVLFLLKLRAHRMQNQADVVALVKAGVDAGAIRRWLLARNETTAVSLLDRLVVKAQEES